MASRLTKDNDHTNRLILRFSVIVGIMVLVIVIGIGLVVVTLALDFRTVVEDVRDIGRESRRQTVVNEIEVLRHRERNEVCVVEYLKQLAQAREANHPLTQIGQCEADDIPEIKEDLRRAEMRLKEIDDRASDGR